MRIFVILFFVVFNLNQITAQNKPVVKKDSTIFTSFKGMPLKQMKAPGHPFVLVPTGRLFCLI